MIDIELMKDIKIKQIAEENAMLLNRIKTLEEQSNVENIELVTKEEVAKDVACQTPYTTLAWLNTLTQLEECGYHICKVKEVKEGRK